MLLIATATFIKAIKEPDLKNESGILLMSCRTDRLQELEKVVKRQCLAVLEIWTGSDTNTEGRSMLKDISEL